MENDIVELQRYVLGCFMIEDTYYRADSLLHDDCFDGGLLRNVYHCIKKLHAEGTKIDMLSVVHEYKQANKTINPYDIVTMTNMVNNTHNLERQCIELKKYAVGVQLKKHTDNVRHLIATDAPFDVLDRAQSELNRIAQLAFDNANKSFKASIPNVLNEIGHRMNNKHEVHGVESGFASIDRVTCGFQNSDLIILAARPGMGKTALALAVAIGAAKSFANKDEKKSVAIASLEMSSDQLIKRLIISEAEVNNDDVKSGKITQEEFARLCDAGAKVQQLPIEINDKQGQTISQLRSFLMKTKHEQGLGLVIVDYIQLMQDPDYRGNKTAEVTAISQGLKGLAKDFDVPVIALSQLSRAVETRGGDKVPMLSDLRDSGAIEQDADMIAFLYRPEYYGITEDEDGTPTIGRADCLIRKNRNGSLEDIHLMFKGKYIKFCEWQQQHQQQNNYQEPQQNNLTGRFKPDF